MCLDSTKTCVAFCELRSLLFFFFVSCSRGQQLFLLFRPFITSVGPVHCSQDPQISLFSNFFIKNGSHDTIHTFKNYFATMFSVSVFSFSKNKLNPNRPKICLEAEKM